MLEEFRRMGTPGSEAERRITQKLRTTQETSKQN